MQTTVPNYSINHSPWRVRCAQIGVLNWFAKLWEIDQEEYWGYVTNCGTEGNLHGVLVGRENLPDGRAQPRNPSHMPPMLCSAPLGSLSPPWLRRLGRWGGSPSSCVPCAHEYPNCGDHILSPEECVCTARLCDTP